MHVCTYKNGPWDFQHGKEDADLLTPDGEGGDVANVRPSREINDQILVVIARSLCKCTSIVTSVKREFDEHYSRDAL